MYDLIVIGGGPAALSAASYSLGKGLKIALIYEKLGGKAQWSQSLADLDEERRLPGSEVVRMLSLRVSDHTSTTLIDRVEHVARIEHGFDIVTRAHGTLTSSAVIVATGATPLPLRVPGAERLIHNGMGYSIRTYSHLARGKRIAVIGLTQRSLRGAAELSRIAAHVTLIAPAMRDHDTPLARALATRANVELLVGYEVTEVIGTLGMAGLRVTRDGTTRLIDVDHAFVDLGLVPNSAMVHDLVQTDSRGFILVDKFNATSEPGIFAAGDITASPGEQVLIAVGDGALAAMSAYDYLLARWLAEQAIAAHH